MEQSSGTCPRPLDGLGQVQQVEDLVAGRHAVYGDVEKGAQLPHGDKEVCREQDDEQAARQRDLPGPELRRRHHHDQGRAAAMAAGISGTHTSSTTAEGRLTKLRQTNRVSGASMAQKLLIDHLPQSPLHHLGER